jgi:hypothetical protein
VSLGAWMIVHGCMQVFRTATWAAQDGWPGVDNADWLAHVVYHAATPDTLQRRFLNTGGIIEHDRGQTTVRLARRTYSPILRQASLPDTITVPWWGGRILRYQYA